jgi:hypothetical protein
MSRGRPRQWIERLLVLLVLTAGFGRAAVSFPAVPFPAASLPADPHASDGFPIPEMIRSYVGEGADTIRLVPLVPPAVRMLVFLPGRPAGPGIPRAERSDLARMGRVLWIGERHAIIDCDPERRRELAGSFEILPFPRGETPRLARRDLPPPPDRVEPVIAAAVEAVDRARLEEIATTLVDFGSRRSTNPGGFAAQGYIHEQFVSYGLADVTDFDYNDWSDNVVAVQPGLITPERIFVIGGHYDSFSRTPPDEPGADDNASGTAGVLEIARVLSRLRFESTIIYIAFSGEEEGLVGSGEWAVWAAGEGLDLRAMVNLDMLGYVAPGDTRDLDLITNGLYPDLEAFTIAAVGLYLPGYPLLPDQILHGGTSDQASFWAIGVPGIFLFEDVQGECPYIHTPHDRIGLSLNDFDFMRLNVQAAMSVIASLASPLKISIAHRPIVEQSARALSYRVRARIGSDTPLVTDSLYVRYRVDGGPFAIVPLESVAEATASGMDSSLFQAAIPAQPAGSRVEYAIHAENTDGLEQDDPPGAPARLHSFDVGYAVRFVDTFDIDCGWSVGDPNDTATTGIWIRAIPLGTGAQPGADADGDSAGFCFVTGNGEPGGAQGDQDVDGGRTTLTSPRIDLSGLQGVRIEYARWFTDESHPDDTLRVAISNDDGNGWIPLEDVTTGERAWTSVRFDSVGSLLTLTDRMRIRFVAEDVGMPSLVEAGIDNFWIRGYRPDGAPPPARPEPRLAIGAWPNPFRSEVHIAFELPRRGYPALGIYDARGRRVVTLAGREPRCPPPRAEILWDGCDAHGRRLPAGVYFVRIESTGSVSGGLDRGTLRIIKVR